MYRSQAIIRGSWSRTRVQEAGAGSRNLGGMLLTGSLVLVCSPTVIQPRTICPGMGLPKWAEHFYIN